MQLTLTTEPEATLAPWRSFEIVRGAAVASPLLILCDHASNRLPPDYGTLGLDAAQMQRHIAYDIGAHAVALEIGRRLGATVISSGFSRLLIDPNRGEDDPTLIMQISDGAVVPGNARVSEAERQRRIARFFTPYHAAIAAEIDALTHCGAVPVILSMHSYTDNWRGVPRKWHAAVLWDKDPALRFRCCGSFASAPARNRRQRALYRFLRNDTIYRHATLRGLPNALVEVRQDLIRDRKGQLEWGALLAECVADILSGAATAAPLARVEHFGSYSDEEEARPGAP